MPFEDITREPSDLISPVGMADVESLFTTLPVRDDY